MPVVAERLEQFMQDSVHLRFGKGSGLIDGKIDMCFNQAADWLNGGDGLTDAPECVCPVIRTFGMGLNDSALFRLNRDLLKPFSLLVVGTRNPSLESKRAFIAVDYACRKFAPLALRRAGFVDEAVQLESLPQIVDRETARSAANSAADSAEYSASSAADSAADSATNWATRSAISAAYSAISAARSANSVTVRTLALECLRAMIECE